MKISKVTLLRNQLYHLLLWYENRSAGFKSRCNKQIWIEAARVLRETGPKRYRVAVEDK